MNGKRLDEFKEHICDNFCKYRDTCDENEECDVTRDGGVCPLEALDEMVED